MQQSFKSLDIFGYSSKSQICFNMPLLSRQMKIFLGCSLSKKYLHPQLFFYAHVQVTFKV